MKNRISNLSEHGLFIQSVSEKKKKAQIADKIL